MPIVLGEVKLYSVSELSETLDINVQTVRKMFNTGKLKGRKMGRKWYVTEEALKQNFDGEDE